MKNTMKISTVISMKNRMKISIKISWKIPTRDLNENLQIFTLSIKNPNFVKNRKT